MRSSLCIFIFAFLISVVLCITQEDSSVASGSPSPCKSENGRCICPTTLVKVGDSCYPQPKKLGDSCEVDSHCSTALGDRTECSEVGKCACLTGNVANSRRDDCLPVRTQIGDECMEPAQCKLTRSRQELGDCVDSKCTCSSTAVNEDGQHICYEKAVKVWDPCEVDIQCQAQLGNDSGCAENKICICRNGTVPTEKFSRCDYAAGPAPIGSHCISGNNHACSGSNGTSECQSGICACVAGYVSTNDKSDCLPIQNLIGGECLQNPQCHTGTPGRHSECTADLSGKMSCQCKSNFVNFAGPNRCRRIAAQIGSRCVDDIQCATGIPHSLCVKGRCQCVFHNPELPSRSTRNRSVKSCPNAPPPMSQVPVPTSPAPHSTQQPFHGRSADINITKLKLCGITPANFYPGRRRTNSGNQLGIGLSAFRRNNLSEVLQSTNFTPTTYESHNGFVLTVMKAYNGHHNLVIRPDDVWAAIMTQFSFYINKHAEEFRSHFVKFQGKKKLEVNVVGSSLRSVSYSYLVNLMTEKIDENLVDPEVKNWVLPAFSTTTPNDRVTVGVIFMGSMKKYFDYGFGILCGIPWVALEGTVADWVEIYNRLEKLKDYNLALWYDMLEPILKQFVATKEGNVDLEFWRKMVSAGSCGCGCQYIAGWINVFAVFNEDGEWQQSQTEYDYYQFPQNRNATISQKQKGKYPSLRFDVDNIPSGTVEVDVTIDDHGKEYKSVLLGGHMAMEVVDDSKTLKPALGWLIAI